MESTAQHVKEILSKTGEMIETKAKLWKLKAVDKGSEVVSSVVASLILILLFGLAVLLLSVGLAIIIGQLLGEWYYGFLIMAGVYGLAGLLFYVNRKTWIKEPVSDRIIEQILN